MYIMARKSDTIHHGVEAVNNFVLGSSAHSCGTTRQGIEQKSTPKPSSQSYIGSIGPSPFPFFFGLTTHSKGKLAGNLWQRLFIKTPAILNRYHYKMTRGAKARFL